MSRADATGLGAAVLVAMIVGCGGQTTGTRAHVDVGGGGRDGSASGSTGGVTDASAAGGSHLGNFDGAAASNGGSDGGHHTRSPGSIDGGGADASMTTLVDGRAPGPCDVLDGDAASPCHGSATSTLPGVSVRLLPTRCSYTVNEALSGVDVPYRVAVDERVAGLVPMSLDDGRCDGPDASGLIPFVDVTGGGQRYCICDTGLCAPPSQTPIELAPGCYAGTAHWEGVNWWGPSDTGNPKGLAFPPGDYTVELRYGAQLVHDGGTTGTTGISVEATMVVTITP